MGRGRKGLTDQSERKLKYGTHKRETKAEITSFFKCVPNNDKKILFLPEEAVEAMKRLPPQQLVNILLKDDDWHVKTSTNNASGS